MAYLALSGKYNNDHLLRQGFNLRGDSVSKPGRISCLSLKTKGGQILGEPLPSFHTEEAGLQHQDRMAAVVETERVPSASKKEGRQTKRGFLPGLPYIRATLGRSRLPREGLPLCESFQEHLHEPTRVSSLVPYPIKLTTSEAVKLAHGAVLTVSSLGHACH